MIEPVTMDGRIELRRIENDEVMRWWCGACNVNDNEWWINTEWMVNMNKEKLVHFRGKRLKLFGRERAWHMRAPYTWLFAVYSVFRNILKCPRYHDFRDTPFTNIFQAFYSALPIAVYVLFVPLFCPFLRFFPVSYVSRPCISIQMWLDT